MTRQRARIRLLGRLWKIVVGSIVIGGLFSIVAVGGGFGGPTDGVVADGAKAIAVIEFVTALTLILVFIVLLRYVIELKRSGSESSTSRRH